MLACVSFPSWFGAFVVATVATPLLLLGGALLRPRSAAVVTSAWCYAMVFGPVVGFSLLAGLYLPASVLGLLVGCALLATRVPPRERPRRGPVPSGF